jgi:hypothetical protein
MYNCSLNSLKTGNETVKLSLAPNIIITPEDGQMANTQRVQIKLYVIQMATF